jgi:hypothetical protein
VLAADNQPNIRSISDFRKIHLKTLEGLFEEALKIALEACALKVGRVARRHDDQGSFLPDSCCSETDFHAELGGSGPTGLKEGR